MVVFAGPCAVEDEEQIMSTARMARAQGAQILRGGAFKPRSSPYSFRGLGEEGLKLLAKAGNEIRSAAKTPAAVPSRHLSGQVQPVGVERRVTVHHRTHREGRILVHPSW